MGFGEAAKLRPNSSPSSHTMKILEVTDFYYPWIGGPAPLVQALSRSLTERGHEVRIICASPTGKRDVEPGPPPIHRVASLGVPFGYRLRAGLPLLDMRRMLGGWRPDVVHIHHPFPISLTALAWARALGLPVVATNHTIPECSLYGLRNHLAYRAVESLFSFHIRTVLGLADVVATPTQTAVVQLKDLGFRRPVVAISNGVDADRFAPPNESQQAGTPLVLYTGRLDAEKELDTLIAAIPYVVERMDARFRIGGEGTDRRRLEEAVAEAGLTNRVEFSGYVPEVELPNVYRQASLYVMPSPVELQSISTLEAMASGLPVVAVGAGALPELVKPGINGYLVGRGDAPAFAEAIVRILQDGMRRETMGRAARETALHHGVQAMIAAYEQIFERLVCEQLPRAVARAARG